MLPAIQPGRVLIINKAAYGLRLPGAGTYFLRWSLPKEGSVVVFYTPSGEIAVKRCVRIFQNKTFFAQGDNGDESYDSRSYGPVPVDHIIGKAWGIK